MLSEIKRNWHGDTYEEKPLLARLGLHAAELAVPAESLSLRAPLPRDMSALINQIKKISKSPVPDPIVKFVFDSNF